MTAINTGIQIGDRLTIPAGEFLFDENAATTWIPAAPRKARVVAVIGDVVCHVESATALGRKTFCRVASVSAAKWKTI